MGTVMVGAALVLIVVCIIRTILRDRRKGKASCGGNCGKCRGCH